MGTTMTADAHCYNSISWQNQRALATALIVGSRLFPYLCLVFRELAHAGLARRADCRLLRLPQGLLGRVLFHVLAHLLLVLLRPVIHFNCKEFCYLLATFYFSVPVEVECGGVPVQRVCRVGVCEQLWQEALEDVGEVVERRPRLVDNVQADGARHLVDVRVIDLNKKAKDTLVSQRQLGNPCSNFY